MCARRHTFSSCRHFKADREFGNTHPCVSERDACKRNVLRSWLVPNGGAARPNNHMHPQFSGQQVSFSTIAESLIERPPSSVQRPSFPSSAAGRICCVTPLSDSIIMPCELGLILNVHRACFPSPIQLTHCSRETSLRFPSSPRGMHGFRQVGNWTIVIVALLHPRPARLLDAICVCG